MQQLLFSYECGAADNYISRAARVVVRSIISLDTVLLFYAVL